MKKIIFLLSSMLLLWSACRKDKIETTSTITNPTPVEYVKSTIGGVVISEYGQPIANAKVIIGDKTTQTNAEGVFQITNVIVNSKGAYVKVEHPNYFHGSRTLNVAFSSRNKVKIRLMSNDITKFIAANQGGVADFVDYSVTLPANGVVNTNGGIFAGQIKVAAKWIDPSSQFLNELEPGRLMGVRAGGSLSGMRMLAVELKDATGQKLQIKSGSEAIIRMRVPTALVSKAEATIPLWYFNEDEGIWVEEGEATLVNGFYEGRVKHFSFWNCDYPNPTVEVKFNVVDQNGNPIPNALVSAQITNGGGYGGSGFTDNNGQVCGIVPKDEVLTMSVYPSYSNCFEEILIQEVGPFSESAIITLTVNLTQLNVYTITGRLLDCTGNPVSNGYVRISDALLGQDSLYLYDVNLANADGTFIYIYKSCTAINSLSFTAYDLDNLQVSAPILVNLSGGIGNAGDISVCGAIQEYFTFTTTSAGTYTSVLPAFSASDSTAGGPIDYINLNTFSQNGGLYIGIWLQNVTGVGNYIPTSILVEGNYNGVSEYDVCPNNDCSAMNVTITEYNGIGGILAGTYSGQLFDNNLNALKDVSGTFRGTLTQ
jgi:hypothetical protein